MALGYRFRLGISPWDRYRRHGTYIYTLPPCYWHLVVATELPMVGKWALRILLEFFLVTVRKRSLRRLCFYTCLSFCSQGGSASVHAGIPPPHLPPPGTRHPPDQTPPEQTPPWDQTAPPSGSRDGYCCGRYASYWNAFLLNCNYLDKFCYHLFQKNDILFCSESVPKSARWGFKN